MRAGCSCFAIPITLKPASRSRLAPSQTVSSPTQQFCVRRLRKPASPAWSWTCSWGETVCDVSDLGRHEIHHRYYYHLRCSGDPPQVWRHWERDASDGSPPIEFELFWAPLPDGLPQLLPAHAAMLPRLVARLGL
jgi:hypothetical protein